MSLVAQLQTDRVDAAKRGDTRTAGALAYLIAQLQNRAIEKRAKEGNDALTDAEAVDVIKKEVKRRRESIDLYEKGNRPELAAKEKEELACLERYLPPTLDAATIEKVVDKIIASGAKDVGAIMGSVMRELKGQADGAVVRGIVVKKLNQNGA